MRRLGLLAGMLLLAGSFLLAGGTDLLIQQRQAELASLKQEIEQRRTRIAELRKEGEDIEVVLGELERQRALTQRYLQKLGTQIDAIEHDLAGRRAELRRKQEELQSIRGGLRTALIYYYKRGRLNAAELLVSSVTVGEIFARSHYWVRAIAKLRGDIGIASVQASEIESGVRMIESRRAEARGLQREREQQLVLLAGEEEARRRDRAQLDRKIAEYEAQTAKLLETQRQIEELIVAAQRSAGSAGEGLAGFRGRLPWPVAGEVVTRFGTEIHKKYGTKVRHKGIVIAAPEGTPIKAVAGGRVVYNGWFEGYGNTVVLDHGKGFFSLYAHAAEITATRGAVVVAGETIARVGSTDALKGPGLHFEIREGKDARDPLRWLAQR